MSLTVVTAARTRRLTRIEHIKSDLGITDTASDTLLDRYNGAASAAIESFCRRPFARESVTETLAGFGGLELQLSRTPIIAVTQVLLDTDPITDYSIASRDEGTLYRRVGWDWTAQLNPGLGGRQRWPGFGSPIPRAEEPRFSVSYIGGYLLPGDALYQVATVSASAADNSFNDSANGFPALLRAGDVLVASGFANAANNGRFVVTGTPTAGKVQVAGALVTETPGVSRSIYWEPPADCRPFGDVEEACLEAVKAWYQRRKQDPDVVEKQVGSLRVRWSEGDQAAQLPLPGVCVGLLGPWVRAA